MEQSLPNKPNEYQEFNDFQQAFYCNSHTFAGYSKYEIKKHSYRLLTTTLKQFPVRAIQVYSMKGIGWTGPESPAIMLALSKSFTVSSRSSRLPDFIYWKTIKSEKDKTKVKTTADGLIFDDRVVFDICSALMVDSKTFKAIQFSDKVQSIGKQIVGSIIQETSVPKKKAKSTKIK